MKLFRKLFPVIAAYMLSSCSGKTQKLPVSQGVTADEVLVANAAVTSGAYAFTGVPFLGGMRAYFKMINRSGGIAGRTIRFIHIDDEFNGNRGKTIIKKFVEEQKVFAIVGHFGTPTVASTVDALKSYGIPTVYCATGINQLYNEHAQGNERAVFPVQPIYVSEGKIMVAHAVGTFNAKKIGIIYTNDAAGSDMFRGAQSEAKKLNVSSVNEQVKTGATDVRAAVSKIKNAKVDFIIGASLQGTLVSIIRELANQHAGCDVITTYANVSTSIANETWQYLRGNFNLYGNGWVNFDAENSEADRELFVKWISEKYAKNQYAYAGWIAASFFSEGLRRVGDAPLNWENYISAMESVPVKNPFGGEIDFSNGRREGTTVMNLSKVTSEKTWKQIAGFQSIAKILGN